MTIEGFEQAKTDEERKVFWDKISTPQSLIGKFREYHKEGGVMGAFMNIIGMVAGIMAVPTQAGQKYWNPFTEKYVSQPRTRELQYQLLDATSLTTLWLRGRITDEKYKFEMNTHGYNEERIDWTKILTEYIPSPTDLIRLAVREAFDEDLVERAKKEYPTPEGLIEWGKKVGLTEDWADKFWYAHWVLPSPTQLYEMLHRGLIDRDDLKKWLHLNDVHPLMVENLMDISYNVLTRVDARRMYQAGVLTRDELLETYMKMGYSPEDAEKLTQWTEVYTLEPEKDFTKTEITKALQIGEIDKLTAIEAFENMGYDEDEADLLVTLYTTAGKSAQKEMTKSMIEQLYKLRMLTKDEAKMRLVGIGYNTEAAEYITQLVDYKIALDMRLLPFSYVVNLFKKGYMSIVDFEDYMYALGYCGRDVDMIIAMETKQKPAYATK